MSHLFLRDIQQTGQLLPVACRLIQHDNELGVGQHGAGLNGVQKILHVLRDGGGVGVALAELPPRGVEKGGGKLVLKHDVELVDKDVGALAFLPIQGDAVEHGVGDNKVADGLQLFAQAVDVEHHHPLVQVNGAFMAENVKGAGGEQLQGQGDLLCHVLRLFHQLLPEGRQGGDGAVLFRFLVHRRRTAVNDGLLLGPHAVGVDALHQGHDKLRFHHNGVVLAVAVHHIHGVQAVFPASGHPDNAAQAVHRFNEGGVLSLRVCDKNIIVRIENEERDFLLDTEGLPGTGDAQPEGGLIEQVRLVAHDKVVGNGVLPEIDTAPVHDLLHLKGHEHGKALGGQGAESVDLPGADGQDGVQAVELLVSQHRQLTMTRQGAYSFRVAVKLPFAVGGDNNGEDGLHHPLVAGGEVCQKLLALLALQLHIVGDDGGEVVVLILAALPI